MAAGSLVTSVPDWSALEAAILASPPSTIGIVDPYEAGEENRPAPHLRDLLRRLPSASIVPALDVTPERASDVARMDDWGIADLISTGHDDTPEAIRQRLADACARPLKRLIATLLPSDTSPHAYLLLSAAAETICDGGTVADFSSALNVSPSTLLRWCEEALLPNPRTLLQWVRMLLAGNLLAEQPRTIENVASASGYATPAELRRVMLRLVGSTPAQLRASNDAIARVSIQFLRAVAPARS
jgi:AraC-like DNA-binding protein